MSAESVGEKLDRIAMHVERLDRRDRLRTWMGMLRGFVWIAMALFFVWSSIFFAQNFDDIMTKIITISTEQTMKYTQDQSAEMMKAFQNMIPKR